MKIVLILIQVFCSFLQSSLDKHFLVILRFPTSPSSKVNLINFDKAILSWHFRWGKIDFIFFYLNSSVGLLLKRKNT